MVTLEKLREHWGKSGVHMYCLDCDSRYSANPSDYFAMPEDHVFKCCDEEVCLVQESKTHTIL